MAYIMLFCVVVMTSGVCFAGDIAKEADATTYTQISTEAQKYLWEGHSKIRDNEDGTVTVLGHTKAYEDVDLVSLTLRLQIEDGSSWKTVKSWNYKDIDTDYIKGSRKYKISRGKKYRVYAVHEVWKDKTHERGTSTTGWVLP